MYTRKKKVQSLESKAGGQHFSVGIMEAGNYIFPNDHEERIKIVAGYAEINGRFLDTNDTCTIPAGKGLQIKIETICAYICTYH